MPLIDTPGHWDQAFWIPVPFDWRSKSNSRRSKTYDTDEHKFRVRNANFVEHLRLLALRELPSDWTLGDRSAPLSSRPSVGSLMWARTPIDAGNLSKSALDALENLAYYNDASVRASLCISDRPNNKARIGLLALARYQDPQLTPQVSADLINLLPSLIGALESSLVITLE